MTEVDLSVFGGDATDKMSDDERRRVIRQIIERATPEQKLQLAGLFMRKHADEAKSSAAIKEAPQTPDELWDYIHETWGIKIARVAVCDDHDAPFDFICLGFFELVPNLFCIGPRGGGKCLAEGTPVYDPITGLDRPIEQVAAGLSTVASMGADGSITRSLVGAAYFSGRKECFRVTTASGRSVVASADHPLLTADGWTRIEEVEVGQTVALPMRLPEPMSDGIPSQHLDLLAILLAEGNYTAQSTVKFTSFDDEIVRIAEEAAEIMGGRLSRHAKEGSYGLVRARGTAKENPFRLMLDSYGIGHQKAPSKRIPDAVMAAPAEQVRRFLSIFWMCDGWVGHKGPEICLASESMVRQIQRLLLRLGIQSRVSKASKGYGTEKVFDCWRLVVYARFVEDFEQQIVLWGDKATKLREIASKKRNGNAGRPEIPSWLPDLLGAPLASMTREERGERSRSIATDLGWGSNRHTKGVQALTAGGVKTVQTRRLRSMCERTPGIAKRAIAHLLSDDLWWDPVISIEPVGERATYDLTIPSTGCFVAGDVLVHNSFDTSLLMELNSRWKPGCESMVFGAVDEQNNKVYQDLVEHFINGGLPEGESEIVGQPLKSLVQYTNGSKAKSFPGTVAKMNGQHPPKAHCEETEIFKSDAYRESRNMAAAKVMPDGRVIKAQNFGTSTRKWKNGRVDKIYQAFLKAKHAALKKLGKTEVDDEVRDLIAITSPWYCVIYCLFEIAAQVPNCRAAEENKGKSDLCKCDQVINGTWDREGEVPRTLESVCRGRLYRSRGHRSYDEVIQLFLQNDRGTWEAQQECIEAESEGLYVQCFSKRRHGLQFFPLDPANGPIYTGTDWGTTHYACTLWVQYLERDVTAVRYEGGEIVIRAGSRVVFAEFYEPNLTSAEMGEKVIAKEVMMAKPLSWDRIPVRKRWADVQGKGDRRVWRKMGLPTANYSTRIFSEHVKTVRGLYENDRAYVVVPSCPNYVNEIESWRSDDKGNEVDENLNHAMAAGRYVFYGMRDIYNDDGPLPGLISESEVGPAAVEMPQAGGLAFISDEAAPTSDEAALEDELSWMSGMRV